MSRKNPKIIAEFGPGHFIQIGWRPPRYQYRCTPCTIPMSTHSSSERGALEAFAKAHASSVHGVAVEPVNMEPVKIRRTIFGQWTDDNSPISDVEWQSNG